MLKPFLSMHEEIMVPRPDVTIFKNRMTMACDSWTSTIDPGQQGSGLALIISEAYIGYYGLGYGFSTAVSYEACDISTGTGSYCYALAD